MKIAASSRRSCASHPRKGFLVIDMILGIAVLTLVFGSTALVLTGLTRQRIIAAQQVLATETIANIFEELATSPIASADEIAETIKLPDDVVRRIPGAKLDFDVAAFDESPSRQVTCTITWPSAPGQPPHRCALTSWSFADE